MEEVFPTQVGACTVRHDMFVNLLAYYSFVMYAYGNDKWTIKAIILFPEVASLLRVFGSFLFHLFPKISLNGN